MADLDNLIDWDHALDSVGGDPDLLKAVIAAFLVEGPAKAQEIRTAIEARQAKTLERAAHTLKANRKALS